MLSQTSRQEIVKRIQSKIGYSFDENNLSPAMRQAITNLATVQRHLYVITELLRGEKSRIDRSAILSVASKLGKDSGKAERASLTDEIGKLQAEIDSKTSELTKQINAELNAHQAGTPPPEYQGAPEMVQLNCPACAAPLPIPTGSITKCQYCNATLRIQDISAQLHTMIQTI